MGTRNTSVTTGTPHYTSYVKRSFVDPDPLDPYVFGSPGFSDPDPLVRSTDLDPDPSIVKQRKTLISIVL